MKYYALTPIQATCPVCYCSVAHLLYVVNSNQSARHIFNERKNPHQFMRLKSHIEALWLSDFCNIVRCDECHFCFALPYVPGDSLYYEFVYNDQTQYVAWKWEFQVTFETLQDLVRQGELGEFRLLEVGAGNGSFIRRVTPKLTSKSNVLCTEYSKHGSGEIINYGVRCLQQDIRDLSAIKYREYFDVICMFQVLEHMDRLDTLFGCFTHLTTRRAHLFIAVPNYMQREFYDLHGIREDIPPCHIGRWNKKCFEIIAGRHGWAVVRHELEPQSALSKTKKFVRLRFNNSEVAKRLDGIQNRPVRRILKAIALSLCGLNSLPEVMRLSQGCFGVSQWIHLRKV